MGFIYIRFNPDAPRTLFLLSTLPIGILFLTFVVAVVYDMKHILIKNIPVTPSRRAFLKKGLDYMALITLVGVNAKAFDEAKMIDVEKVDIKIANLKKPYSIVQLSDVHIGGIIDHVFIKKMVDRVNALSPDLVVITGDLVDIKLAYAMPALNELQKLKSRYGTYFVVGNHEYFHGLEEIIQRINALGVKTLENENIYIGNQGEGFNLAGVYDYFGYRADHHQPDLEKALLTTVPNAPTVLLAHQPVYIKEVDDRIDLVLSGHTHGGQIYPFRALVKLVQPYITGLYRHSEKTQIYVNRGTGFWGPPMRLGASSEITYITIS
jgi:predicted MPP superfamily phosphohydrolase